MASAKKCLTRQVRSVQRLHPMLGLERSSKLRPTEMDQLPACSTHVSHRSQAACHRACQMSELNYMLLVGWRRCQQLADTSLLKMLLSA